MSCWTKNNEEAIPCKPCQQAYGTNQHTYFSLAKLLLTNNKHCCLLHILASTTSEVSSLTDSHCLSKRSIDFSSMSPMKSNAMK
jgi:hypothetical protein